MRKKSKRQTIIMIVILLILFLGLGYAYLSTDLNILGTSNVSKNTWNVYWDNIQVRSGSVTGEQVIQAPEIDSTKTVVNFRINLKKPGDYYEFTVDAKNDGSLDAMIDTIIEVDYIPYYINFIFTYEDGIEINRNHLLQANTSEKYKIRVEYSTDIEPDDLPDESETLNLDFGVTYIQADESATPIRRTLFRSRVGDFNTQEDAIASHNCPVFLKLIEVNNTIRKAYAGIVYNNHTYLLEGDNDGSNYETNKALLLNTFGDDYCTITSYNNFENIDCNDNDSIIHVSANSYGTVYTLTNGIECAVEYRYNNITCGFAS